MPTITNFGPPGEISQIAEPFIAPPGVTAPAITPGGAPTAVQPYNYNLFCTLALAQSLLAQYEQAAALLGLAFLIPPSVVDVTSTYPYSRPSDGSLIYAIQGTLVDSSGNLYGINDNAGQRIWGYVFPFAPGKQTFGDKNYIVEPVYVNGVQQQGVTNNVAVPGYLTLVVGGGAAVGKWVTAPTS